MIHYIYIVFLLQGIYFPHYPGYHIVVTPQAVDSDHYTFSSIYIDYLQWARWDLLERSGYTRTRLSTLRSIPMTKSITIKYKDRACIGQELKVTVRLMWVKDAMYCCHQEIWSFDQILAEADVIIINYDPVEKCPRRIPDELREVLCQ